VCQRIGQGDPGSDTSSLLGKALDLQQIDIGPAIRQTSLTG
jgi:hypothetical protein